MPGPVSDSFDPEYGTSFRASIVKDGITAVRDEISKAIGSEELQEIVGLCTEEDKEDDPRIELKLTERQLRIIRFCMNRELEAI